MVKIWGAIIKHFKPKEQPKIQCGNNTMQAGIEFCNAHKQHCGKCPLFNKMCINSFGRLCGAESGDNYEEFIKKHREMIRILHNNL